MYYVLQNWNIYYDIGAGKPAKYRAKFTTMAAARNYVRTRKGAGQ